ncbi:hypothetical protein [Sphingobacterium anhuiense]|uniref:hypothetical protein n=1 Tax=Sphingobacterium anhuiense TaxID=493780 RepID=UPI003C2D97B6
MKPQDLRIGNWAILSVMKTKHYGQIHSLTPIHLLIGDGIKCDYSDLEPIIISEELLMKLGATKFPDGQSLLLNNRLIGYRQCSNVFYDKSTGINVQFVHQLQNLFYELTGVEMEVKL